MELVPEHCSTFCNSYINIHFLLFHSIIFSPLNPNKTSAISFILKQTISASDSIVLSAKWQNLNSWYLPAIPCCFVKHENKNFYSWSFPKSCSFCPYLPKNAINHSAVPEGISFESFILLNFMNSNQINTKFCHFSIGKGIYSIFHLFFAVFLTLDVLSFS